jgi:hypothetical protein
MNDSHRNERYFDYEKLEAYRQVRMAAAFVAARRRKLVGLPGKVGEQLERAIAGAFTNICSASSAQGAERRRQFRIALTEATEAGGASELALIYGAFREAESRELREMLLRACRCLHGLCS